MAEKKKWIKGAVGKPGTFRKKAEAAGETTREYAEEKKDAPGKLGKEARLAGTLMGMSKRRSIYNHPRSMKAHGNG